MTNGANLHPDLDLLEATLRDGSYVVNFQFTAADTAWLAAQLEAAGINWIEIGHGLGMGASRAYRQAAASDEEYIRAAAGVLTRAKFGMFCIPGVAALDDLRMAADLGMHFVRIGANCDRAAEMEPYIGLARKLGFRVCTNFMKSYTLPAKEFATLAKNAQGWGSQMNYLVDSAGGMLPHEVRSYCEAMAEQTTIPYGFHGHDNIRLAIANSLVAIDCGALWVDTTLFGVGRGSGNAATELMAGLLQRRYGLLKHVDINRLIQLADSQALPLTFHRRQETLSLSLGLAQVHSMYLEQIVERSKVEGVDQHDLIAAVGEVDRLEVDDDILRRAVEMVRARPTSVKLPEGGIFQTGDADSLEDAIQAAENIAEKLGLPCQIWVTTSSDWDFTRVGNTGHTIEVRASGDPARVANVAKGKTTTIILAPNLAEFAAKIRRPGGPEVKVADVGPKAASAGVS